MKRKLKNGIALASLCAVLLLASSFTGTRPRAIILDEVPNAIALSVDHSTWNALLQKHVDTEGRVDYSAFKSDANLAKYLAMLGSKHPDNSWSREEQMAFWINAYNAFTVKLIVDNYPLKSITDLQEPWKQPIVKLKGKTYTLDHLENKILRPEFKDPRIHYAINCASFSCPPLLNEAFSASNLEKQLYKVAHGFVNDPQRNEIGTHSAKLSQIFEWFKADFEVDGGVIAHINKYARGAMDPKATITYMDYDWNLNEQK